MSVYDYASWLAAAKPVYPNAKTASRTSVALTWFSTFDLAGNPGAGVLAGTSTTAGVVPTNATAGTLAFPNVNPGQTVYFATINGGNSVASRVMLADMLWKGGAYSFNSNVTVTSPPSYASRCQLAGSWAASTVFRVGDRVVNNSNLYVCSSPGTSASSGGPTTTGSAIADGSCAWNYVSAGIDYQGTSIWVETVTAFTGNMSIAVTYTNQSGTTGRTTGTVATGVAPTLGRKIQLPLQSGDTGVQKIESVVGSVATVGTFNVLVLKQYYQGRVRVANDGFVNGMSGVDTTNMPVMGNGAALIMPVMADSTATGLPEVNVGFVVG